MLGSLGLPELLFIMVLALLVFGPRKLPEIGRTLGRALGEFRRATSDLKRSIDVELKADEFREQAKPSAAAERPVPEVRPAASVLGSAVEMRSRSGASEPAPAAAESSGAPEASTTEAAASKAAFEEPAASADGEPDDAPDNGSRTGGAG